MPDIAEGEVVEVQGSATLPYKLRNVGGVYSCSCPAWTNAGGPIDLRTCKHLKAYRGEAAEIARVGDAAKGGKPVKAAKASTSSGGAGDDDGEATGDAPPVLLAHKWENDVELAGWWMSEKLDGVRAWWDGEKFLSRLGNAFLAPSWFTKDLPKHPLDGELWLARKEFQKCVSIVRSANAGEQWKQLKYLVFDAPAVDGAFEQRVEVVEKLFGNGQSAYAEPVKHVRCEGVVHLRTELARVEGLGGEGLMLRQPGSKYVNGRSTTLLKVKTFHDAEGRVIAHDPGKGKHKGRLGALVVEMPDGTRFNVGTGFSDVERDDPPPIGSIVTYRYQELTKDGVPRFPSYVGVAIDKSEPTAPSTSKLPTAAPAPTSAPTASAPPTPGAQSTPTSSAQSTPMPGAQSTPSATPTPTSATTTNATTTNATTTNATTNAASTTVTGAFRRFEVDEKFWAIKQDGSSHTVVFGKIGTDGQSKTKTFASEAEAKKEVDKLIAEKTKKGYEEVDADDIDSDNATSAPANAPAPTTAPAQPIAPVSTTIAPASTPALVAKSAPVDDGKSVHEIVKALSDAWRKGRYSEIESMLDAQCVFIKPDRSRVEGRSRCADSYRDFMERTKVIRFAESDHRVDLFGDTAIASCTWEMTFVAQGRPQREKGSETLALARAGGAWRIVWRSLDVTPREQTPAPAAAHSDVGGDDDDDVPESGEGDADD